MNNSVIHTLIILAAGLGSRFEGSEHKSLVALQYGEGSLKRLLRQLKAISVKCHIVIVTGHQADSLVSALSRDFSNLHFVDNSNFSNGSLLESICVGLQTLTNEQGVWILFADTVYHNAALERLLQEPTESITIACAPIDARQEDSIGISFRSEDSQLISIGPFIADMFDGIMIPAVFWPRFYWPTLIDEAKKGIQSQWRVLQKVAIGHTKVVCLESDLVGDIDTRKDLMRMRNNLIGDQVFHYFKKFVSKDERSRLQPDMMQKNCFIKWCETPSLAEIEMSAMAWLKNSQVGSYIPNMPEVHGRRLSMEYVQGIRLYDMFRLLRNLSNKKPTFAKEAESAAYILMQRSVKRLGQIQRALSTWPLAPSLQAYPIDTHVGQLLSAMLYLMQQPSLTEIGYRELKDFSAQWSKFDAVVPFRDATPKNILVAIPELAPSVHRTDEERILALQQWLGQDKAKTVRLVDFDFASVCHLTAPEDDFISLIAHQGSLNNGAPLLASQATVTHDWLQDMFMYPDKFSLGFTADSPRAARALFVRYLRFGGRKLMYRMINPAGFAVRFRYDTPEYYFKMIPKAVQLLDPNFRIRWPELYARVCQLDMAVSQLPPWQPAEATNDLYTDRFGAGPRFWQESPLEHK